MKLENEKKILFLKVSLQHIFIHSGDADLYYNINGNTMEVTIDANMVYSQSFTHSRVIPFDPEVSVKSHLEKFLEDNLGSEFFMDQPLFEESHLFSDEEFQKIVSKVVARREEKNRKTEKIFEDNIIVRFAKKAGLRPRPAENGREHSWYINCPNGNHPIMLELKGSEWGCGYCRKKGGFKELKEWVEEIRNNK
jgi:hypothetical protein